MGELEVPGMQKLAAIVIAGLIAATQLVGCTRSGDGESEQSPSTPTAATSPASTQSPMSPATSPTATPRSTAPSPTLPVGFSEAAKRGGTAPARASLLRTIRFGRHSGYDRVVFEFAGPIPAYAVRYVGQIRQDPSDRPVPLEGKAFLSVVMQGGTLDTTPQVDDPAQAQSYEGPRRTQPDLSVVEEIAAAGDFEAVLTFGVGLDNRALSGCSGSGIQPAS
jgi:hypothetical protein